MTGLAWGLLAPISKLLFGLEPANVDGVGLAVARATWSLPFFVFLLAVTWALERPTFGPRTALAFAGLGACFGPGFMVLYSIAAQATSVSHIAFLVGLTPPVNAAFAALIFRTPLDRVRQVALAAGVLGVTLLALTKPSGGSSLGGDAILIVWLGIFASYATLLRFLSVRHGVAFITALTGTLGCGMLVAGGVLTGHGAAIAHMTDGARVGALFFGEIVVLATLAAPLTFAFALRRAGIAVATSGAEYLAVAVGIAFSLAILHERWQPLLGVAGALMLASLALTFAPADLFARAGRPRPIA